MYHQLATRLYLSNTTPATEFSPPVVIGPDNSVVVDITTYALTATSVAITVQGSNDMQNWTDMGGGAAVTASSVVSATGSPIVNIGTVYVRLKYVLTGSGVAIVAAGLNTFQAVESP